MTNAELIAELRYCAEHEGCDYYIAKDCPREYTWVCGADCEKILMLAAADALEAADIKIADCIAAVDALDDSNDAYIKENERLKKRIAELERILKAVQENSGINFRMWQEAEAQLPKEGEWIENGNGTYSCNRCGSWIPNEQHFYARYCLFCGSRMEKGEQEGER